MIVQKYGGSSLSTPEKIREVADMVSQRLPDGEKSVVVVSAMGDTTDSLIRIASSISKGGDLREMDMLLSSGEQVSASLLAMVLSEKGIPALSMNAFQLGIVTDDNHSDARIKSIDISRIKKGLSDNRVIVVTGFQGISENGDITTLGRGGSDTTAVAIASSLGVPCYIYSDVSGVYTCDPRLEPDAKKLEFITYDEMLELSMLGARVLNPVAVETAKSGRVEVSCCAAFSSENGTRLVSSLPSFYGRTSVTGLAVSKYPFEDKRFLSVDIQDLSVISAVGNSIGNDHAAKTRLSSVLHRESKVFPEVFSSFNSISALIPSSSVIPGVKALAREFSLI